MNLSDLLPSHRKAPMVIPENASDAAAAVISFVKTGGQAPDRSAALEAFRVRLERLTDPDPKVLIEELASHAAVLTALAERWAVESVIARTAEAAARFGKLHLQAQAACLKTLLAVRALQAKGVTVVINDDEA